MYDEFLNFIFPLAKGAGEIQLAYFRGNDLGIETKSNAYDVVTRADKESEAYIVQAILGRYPGHGILGEEGGVMGTAGSDYRWVIDPLDGTTNYSQGLPIFSVSIALQHKGETVAGVVYAPYLGELFWASKGGGAYMKSRSGEVKRLQVSAKQTLATSVLATGFPYDKDVNPDNNSDNVARIVPYVRDIRRLGSAAYDLSCIAAGLLDGYWELDLHEWDVCAANLIVREAGGVVCDFRRNRGVSQAAGNEVLDGLFHRLGGGAHHHDNPLGVGGADVVEELIVAAGERAEAVHGLLHEIREGVVIRVAALPRLKEHVRVLGRASQHRMLG